jgi:hypothetical protein
MYINRQYQVGFPCTIEMITEAASFFREQDHKPPPSETWVRDFIKEYGLKGKKIFKKVKWKPMDKKRRAAQDVDDVIHWFAEYARLRKEHKIYLQNIWNFDETGFRTACPSGVWVWVPWEAPNEV